MKMNRQASGWFRHGELEYSLKRVFRQNVFVFLVVSAVVVAIFATMVQGTPSHAATKADGLAWNPGPVDYVMDNTGCRTSQDATIQTQTPALATTVMKMLTQNRVKTDFPADSPIRALGIDDVEGTSSGMNVHLFGVLSNSACSAAAAAPQSTPAGSPASSPNAQAANLRAGQGTGETSPAMSLDHGRGIQLAAGVWTTVAAALLAAVAVYVAVTVVATAALIAAAVAAGFVMDATAVFAIATASGCVGGMAALVAMENVVGKGVLTWTWVPQIDDLLGA